MKLALMLMVLGAAANSTAPAAPVAKDLVDLLDFDQGTVLLSATQSYSSDVSGWSPFHLSDGNPNEGWCSAQGTPNDNEFVYELEQDSELKTLRVVNTGTDESSYPGVSARTVELWGAGGKGAFEKLGSFEAAKGGAREFPIAANKPVRRVKIVVRKNWGHAEYTEIMELDLLGRKVGIAPALDVTGEYYSTSWSGLRMKQTGTHVEGCYDYAGGIFSGELDGRVAKVVWREFSEGKERSHGTATFVVAADKQSVRGIYFNDSGAVSGVWDLGKPPSDEERPKCTPRGSSLADRLKQDGRVVLYGIRFDVNSDVPRADSEPTLKEVLDLLQREAALKLQVEGHTDSTNTDAYNQDLSDRRARAVVKWLTERGIDGARVKAKGFGRTRPVASNDTSQGRALNRRVELAPLAK